MSIKSWFRSAITGRFVKQQAAQASQETTLEEIAPDWTPLICGFCEETAGRIEKRFEGHILGAICEVCLFSDPAPPEKIWDGKIWYPLEEPEKEGSQLYWNRRAGK